ncbi:MAG: hypothetical protein AUH82_00365 [Chloroflexi bacterium 13_1_40CM_4_65_13]|nr:MAG: hypothetical protein AUH82_00365 [Chloroflexi bacterium 13_1_40CM_4_65_13]
MLTVNVDAGSVVVARRVVSTLAIAYLAVAVFPAAYYALHPGLDISWVYGLNHFVNSPFQFGRDVNFTYGPLGFVLYPANFGNDVLFSILFRVTITVFFVVSLAMLAPGRWLGLLLFSTAYGVALGIGHTFDFHLLVLAALAVLAAIERRSLLGIVLVAAFSGPLWLAKFSLGMGLAAVVLAGSVAWRWVCRGDLSGTLGILLAHLASFLFVAWLLLGSLSNLWLWLRASYEIAGGYSVALSYDPGWTDQRKGVAICAVYLICLAALWRLRHRAALPLALLAGPLFLVFKAGFVREDAHVMSFFGFATAALAIPLLMGTSTRERMVTVAALILVVGLGIRAARYRSYLSAASFAQVASGRLGILGLEKALHNRTTRQELDAITVASIGPDRLPDDVRRAIGAGTVLITPWELVHCLASELNCVPPPTLQEYSAYTPYLDAITAARFEAPESPDFVLVHTLVSTENRHIVIDGPLTWRNLIGRYEPVRLTSREFVLLRRRASPLTVEAVPLSMERLLLDDWIPVPRAPGFLFAEMRFELSWLGKLVKLLHRIPAGHIELRRASGAIERRRLVFETSINGVLVQPFAEDLAGLPALFDPQEGDRVVALRIVGRATRYYSRSVPLRWLTGSLGASPSASHQ